jgi:Sec-independent protein secretion pathway component TatC
MTLNSHKINARLQVPFLLALNLFGFLLEFFLEFPFMIAFFLGTRKAKAKGRHDHSK